MVLEPCELIRLGNSFEDVLGARRPDFMDLRSRLREAGLQEPHMTGSGSAVFGLLGRRVPTRAVLDRFVGGEALFVVRSVRRGLDIDRLR
jgi:4-diphosphocytidyl-2C-methyl-D-erythritol kinase